MGNAYRDFLAAKRIRRRSYGFEPTWFPDKAFGFQRYLIGWNVRLGRSATFAACGLGKTPVQLAVAENVVRHTNGNVLILAPLAVAPQTIREGEKFGVAVRRTKGGKLYRGVSVTNYQQLAHYDPDNYTLVVADECFPSDTLVDTVSSLDNSLERRYIKDIRPGDLILNASGVDRVQACRKRPINRAIRLTARGAPITCSENHPFLTVRGWRYARDLRPGDYLVATETAMHLVREGVSPEIPGQQVCSVLRDVLLSEMADETTRDQTGVSFGRKPTEGRQSTVGVAAGGFGEGQRTVGAYPQPQSDGRSQIGKEDGGDEDKEWNVEAVEGRERRERQRAYRTGKDPARRFGKGLVSLYGQFGGEASGSWISLSLQDRRRQRTSEDRHRSGWPFTQQPQTPGREEGQETDFVRVDRVEVLEQGHSELEKHRDEEGSLCFYDLEAARHPSFSVNGLLVHNSSICKNFDGKTRKLVTDFLSKVKYRLLCTATPAPNDFMELGTSSEALGEMARNQMLAMFFANDGESTQQWRLKGHAKGRFWEWVSSWAKAVRMPSDLGFSDDGFVLPPLEVRQEVVLSERGSGFLPRLARTLAEQRRERRSSLTARCQRAAECVPVKRPCILWCQLNDEADLLEDLVPGAVQVAGSETDEAKEEKLTAFGLGQIRVLVTKPSIACFGLNYQHCADLVYFPTHSHEAYYQAVRRCYRFGQARKVTCHLVHSEAEQLVVSNMLRKERQAEEMYAGICRAVNRPEQRTAESNGLIETEVPTWLKK